MTDLLLQLWTPLEFLAVLASLASVWFSLKRRIATYPFGLVGISIYIFLCYHTGIYADMALNIFYGIMSVYGWFRWLKAPLVSDLVSIRTLTQIQQVCAIAATLLLWGAIYLALVTFTDSSVPILDSATTAFAITGMILMAERYLEYWSCFIVANALSIPLYIHKELHLTAGLFLVLLLAAISGDRRWRLELRKELPTFPNDHR
jgi:nicotinamide mononucleotide transporter